jgi:predicted nucleic acid-binding protein
MHKQRIYIDTSVIGGCFDRMFAEWSNKLFDEFIAGKKIAVISQITLDEISNAPDRVKEKLREIPNIYREILPYSFEIETLANEYIKSNAVTSKSFEDTMHIAYATIYEVNILVSWNFKHIVNINRINKYNSVNLFLGYSILEIRNPREVISDGND